MDLNFLNITIVSRKFMSKKPTSLEEEFKNPYKTGDYFQRAKNLNLIKDDKFP